MKKQTEYRTGDSVKVKDGTLCPDAEELCIGGWQGRITEIEEDEKGGVLLRIRWDSLTLKSMPASFTEESEEEGLDCETMWLAAQDVLAAEPRDTEKDVARAADEISKQYGWVGLGEEGKRIGEVLAGVDPDDEMEAF